MDIKDLKKEELLEIICDMELVLLNLEDKISKGKKFKKGRKEQVLEILQEGKLVGISEIAERLDITNRNVSSQLSYLRDDGHDIARIGRGHGKLKLIV